MRQVKSFLLALFLPCAFINAAAQDVVLTGHVQKITLLPFGADDCPPTCTPDAGRVCIHNSPGCQIMEVSVDKVLLGEAGPVRHFRSHIGEWGPTFRVASWPIVVSEKDGKVSWADATVRGDRLYIDPTQLRSIGDVSARDLQPDEHGLVPLDALLERVRQADARRQRRSLGKE
ncbi:hypothetical protein F2P45_04730 [Massilia sp. CCM 8733]|uniref:Uncharacterized protein n=1 Tax=Massilia mucilaginosa TaxID=2609282 RepID=A0ABX0NNF4_9BURK|nr:hypothetical protein [Massilia mucilaginosa]NHZ88334.1 hypothetical protein [Massilia mucilaginosa]